MLAAVINTESATFPLEKEKRSSEFLAMAYMRNKKKKKREKLNDTISGEFDKPCNISDNVTCCSCNQKNIYMKGNENEIEK